MRAMVTIDPRTISKPRTRAQQHNSLHSTEWCWCKCPQCWYEWKTTNPKTKEAKIVGICICLDCHCPSNGAVYLRPSLGFRKAA